MMTISFLRLPSFILSLSVILAIAPPLLAGGKPSTPPSYSASLLQDLKRLHAAGLETDYAYRQVAHLCNNIGPRLTGSPQCEAAVAYVADQLRRLGLKVSQEPLTIPHWIREEESGQLVEYHGRVPGSTQRLVLTALGGSVSTPPDGITTEVVIVESFDHLKSMDKERIQGKIVLFNVPFDRRMALQGKAGAAYEEVVEYRSSGASQAAAKGAVASLIRSIGGSEYRSIHTGLVWYEKDMPRIPAGALSAEDCSLIAHLAAQGPVTMRLVLKTKTFPDAASSNVIADLVGAEEPRKVVLVSGHLDSWDLATGALDDAAGIAMAMEVCHLVKTLGLRPRRTIRFVAFMGEENSAAGAKAYLRNYKEQLADHVAAIEADLGNGHSVGYDAHVSERALRLLLPLLDVTGQSGASLLTRATEPVGSDVARLGRAGIPTIGLQQDARAYFDFHHSPADTFDKVDPTELKMNSAALAALVYAIASMPETLPR